MRYKLRIYGLTVKHIGHYAGVITLEIDAVHPPRAARRTMAVLLADQVRTLLDGSVEIALGPLYVLAVTTGIGYLAFRMLRRWLVLAPDRGRQRRAGVH